MTSEIDNARQEEVKTRRERRQARVVARAQRSRKQSHETHTGEVVKRHPKVRLIPIWMRLVIVVVLLVISMTAGIIFGYGVIGNGKAFDALKASTWEHIVDLVVKGTDRDTGTGTLSQKTR